MFDEVILATIGVLTLFQAQTRAAAGAAVPPTSGFAGTHRSDPHATGHERQRERGASATQRYVDVVDSSSSRRIERSSRCDYA